MWKSDVGPGAGWGRGGTRGICFHIFGGSICSCSCPLHGGGKLLSGPGFGAVNRASTQSRGVLTPISVLERDRSFPQRPWALLASRAVAPRPWRLPASVRLLRAVGPGDPPGVGCAARHPCRPTERALAAGRPGLLTRGVSWSKYLQTAGPRHRPSGRGSGLRSLRVPT